MTLCDGKLIIVQILDTNTTPMDSSLFDHDLETAWKCGICNDMIIFKISALINHLQLGHKITVKNLAFFIVS